MKILFTYKNLLRVRWQKKIFISDVKYCPYHPNAKIKKFEKDQITENRNLMIKSILKDRLINLNKSFMIGDKHQTLNVLSKVVLDFIILKTILNN